MFSLIPASLQQAIPSPTKFPNNDALKTWTVRGQAISLYLKNYRFEYEKQKIGSVVKPTRYWLPFPGDQTTQEKVDCLMRSFPFFDKDGSIVFKPLSLIKTWACQNHRVNIYQKGEDLEFEVEKIGGAHGVRELFGFSDEELSISQKIEILNMYYPSVDTVGTVTFKPLILVKEWVYPLYQVRLYQKEGEFEFEVQKTGSPPEPRKPLQFDIPRLSAFQKAEFLKMTQPIIHKDLTVEFKSLSHPSRMDPEKILSRNRCAITLAVRGVSHDKRKPKTWAGHAIMVLEMITNQSYDSTLIHLRQAKVANSHVHMAAIGQEVWNGVDWTSPTQDAIRFYEKCQKGSTLTVSREKVNAMLEKVRNQIEHPENYPVIYDISGSSPAAINRHIYVQGVGDVPWKYGLSGNLTRLSYTTELATLLWFKPEDDYGGDWAEIVSEKDLCLANAGATTINFLSRKLFSASDVSKGEMDRRKRYLDSFPEEALGWSNNDTGKDYLTVPFGRIYGKDLYMAIESECIYQCYLENVKKYGRERVKIVLGHNCLSWLVVMTRPLGVRTEGSLAEFARAAITHFTRIPLINAPSLNIERKESKQK